ncbi:MAG TPA: hypothetical protein VJT85_00070 [Gemmatimonadaceae bacterium]|nr:hypothetical protein [Gemmatimonadaceae bacterium]
MSETTQRVLQCDECRARATFEAGDVKLREWFTVCVWKGAPDFSRALEEGPRSMREELVSITGQWQHLCPACGATLRLFVVESFPRALGRPFEHYVYDADDEDEIPF